mgnify:CR=1 FL=1
MRKLIIAIFIISSSMGCKAQKTQTKMLKNESKDHNIKMSLSPNHRFVLHQTLNNISNVTPQPNIKFYVYDLKEDAIVYQNTVTKGKVSWHQEHILKIWTVPGMVKQDHKSSDDIYYLDIRSGKKMNEISESMQQGEI